MKKIVIDNINYELIENYNDGFDFEKLTELFTDYFYDYDYVLGDFAYGKLRLKGFCDKTNKLYNDINNIENYKKYIDEQCAYGCRYFLIKKCKETN